MEFSDYLALFTLLTTAISVVVVISQYIRRINLKRAQYLSEIIENLKSKGDIGEIIYMFEYNYSWYDGSFHENHELERKVDKTIAYLSYICYLRTSNLISKGEFSLLKYYVNHTLLNDSVQAYLYNIYHFSCVILNRTSGANNTEFPFKFILEYGLREKLIGKDFFDKYSTHFPVYLNFR